MPVSTKAIEQRHKAGKKRAQIKKARIINSNLAKHGNNNNNELQNIQSNIKVNLNEIYDFNISQNYTICKYYMESTGLKISKQDNIIFLIYSHLA